MNSFNLLVYPCNVIRSILESIPAGIIITRHNDDKHVYLNKRALDLLHIRPDDSDKITRSSLFDNLSGFNDNGSPLSKNDYPIIKNKYGKKSDLIFYKIHTGVKTFLRMKTSTAVLNKNTKFTITTIVDVTELVNNNEKLKKSTLRLENLWRASSKESITIKEVCDITLDSIVSITKSEYGFYGFIGKHEKDMIIHAWSGDAMRHCSIVDKPLIFSIEHAGIWGEAIRQKKPVIINDYPSSNLEKKGYPAGHVSLINLMIVPYMVKGKVHSVVGVANRPSDYEASHATTVINFLNDIYLVIRRLEVEEQLKESHRIYQKLSTTDPLTGLNNRRTLFETFAKELSRSSRTENATSIILFDLDDFKGINDRYGHNAGDLVLQGVADCLTANLRAMDTAYRFGGEEFFVILPETSLDQAATIAERIRATIEQHVFLYEKRRFTITASFGVSCHQAQAEDVLIKNDTIDFFLREVDQALYRAKALGKNQICAAGKAE